MRTLPLLALLVCLVPTLLAFVLRVPHVEYHEYGILLARETASSTTENPEASPNATTTTAVGGSTATGNSTTSTTASPSVTTIAALNISDPPENGGNSTAPGALTVEPAITPALGVGGFILIVTGVILALIGVRNLWVQVFLSSAFLTSLGVTVLIVYVMNPPVRIAIQGAYLVAIFFTGITFGALAIVFKELAEGLGCLLGGFCTSMWLLCTRPGGLLTETDAKTGFIAAISVGFYALSFSHYTRPYGLIVSTAIAGGTAVALGVDCYSKAGLKEFWLYIWALNDDIFPLGTNTYPVTRNIRVELAATVIVAIMGVVSQLRLWKVVRERRAKEEERRQEEEKQKDEDEVEAAKRLAEHDLKERMEWEAKYGGSGITSSSASIPELPGDSQKCAADEADATEKGETIDMESISDSVGSYRCSECRAMETNGDSASDATGTEGSEARQKDDTDVSARNKYADQTTDDVRGPYAQAFNGAAVAQIRNDKGSDVSVIVGSDSGSIYSRRSSSPVRGQISAGIGGNPVSESQEALIRCEDDASSIQGIVGEPSDLDSACHSTTADSHDQAMSDKEQPLHSEDRPVGDEGSQPSPEGAKGTTDNTGTDTKKEGALFTESHEAQEGINQTVISVEGTESNKANCEKEQVTPVETGCRHDGAENPLAASQSHVNRPEGAEEADISNEKDIQKETEPNTDIDAIDNPSPKKQESRECNNNEQAEGLGRSDENRESKGKGKNSERPEADEGSETNTSLGKKPLEDDYSSPESLHTEEQAKAASTKRSSSQGLADAKPEPKETEPARLKTETVRQIPTHTSRVIQTYRTNEWAKHLADAEVPELEPIQPCEEEQPERPVERAAPVNVDELLQTPVNAQPRPAVEHRASLGKDANDRRRIHESRRSGSQTNKRRSKSPNRISDPSVGSSHSLAQSFSPPATQLHPITDVGNLPSSTLPPNIAPAEPGQGKSESMKPRWKGPPPLIAVREDMVRSRFASVSLSLDPYTRNSPGHSSTDLLPRCSSNFTTHEGDGDNMPLSRRRTMLQQQTTPVPGLASAPSVPPRWNSPTGAPSRANSTAVLAAWRESVREDLREKRDPLKLAHPTIGTGPDSGTSVFGQLAHRNASSASIIGDKLAEGMQRGDMSDLHREAMRRMQAKANQSANSQPSMTSRS